MMWILSQSTIGVFLRLIEFKLKKLKNYQHLDIKVIHFEKMTLEEPIQRIIFALKN
jgi:hypothetical protein